MYTKCKREEIIYDFFYETQTSLNDWKYYRYLRLSGYISVKSRRLL